MNTAVQYARPSNLIIKSIRFIAEWLIDWLFLSTVVVAPLAVVAAVYFFAQRAWLPALACLVLGALAALGIYARFFAPWELRVKHLELTPLQRHIASAPHAATAGHEHSHRRPLKVVFFSDLHVGQFKRQHWAERVVAAVNAQSPDLILIGGDFVGRTHCCDVAELLAPLRGLRATHGVYAVLGNHDYGIPGPDHSDDLVVILPSLNIHVLRNECVRIGADVRVIGVDELWAGRDDLAAALEHCGACDERVNPITRTIVLGHNPDLMLKIEAAFPEPVLKNAFFIFGHTHQGQIRIPLLHRLAVPIKSHFYRGLYHTRYGLLYVSSGCGENSTPTRLNTWPEIVVFEV